MYTDGKAFFDVSSLRLTVEFLRLRKLIARIQIMLEALSLFLTEFVECSSYECEELSYQRIEKEADFVEVTQCTLY